MAAATDRLAWRKFTDHCPRCMVPSGTKHTLGCPIRLWNEELIRRGMWPPPPPPNFSEFLLALCMMAAYETAKGQITALLVEAERYSLR